MDIRKSLDEPLSSYLSKEFVKISMTDSIVAVAGAMQRAGAGEAVVFQNSEPIGIITERDILFKVVAAGKDPSRTQASEVMSSPVESVEEKAKVADAIAKMSRLGVRRLIVTRGKTVVGMVTQKRIVSGQQNLELPELVTPKGVACPYCGAMLKDAEELSKHMDQLHIGEGLLGGDTRKW
ncbi:MAG: CBS domain-containing protein [Nitrososphaerales archaeon]|nr:CBS domain-containing protein [Nitrososphaerales archaeon]